MIAPNHYRDARMKALHHIQGRMIAKYPGSGCLIEVTKVFRGPLKRGAQLTLSFMFPPDGPGWPGMGLPCDVAKFEQYDYLEAFLDADQNVTWTQVKFIPKTTWFPTGNPRVVGYSW